MIRRTESIPKETTKLWRLPKMVGVELLRAKYVTQTFSRHAHEGFAVGVIESGALGFHYRGENVVAPAGAINLAIPDQPHTGHAAVETGWSYRMFYLDAQLLEQAAEEIAGKLCGRPFFRTGVLHDPLLAAAIRDTHIAMERSEAPLLESQSRLLDVLVQLIQRHAHPAPELYHLSRERDSVMRVRDYLEAHYADNPSIQDLAGAAHLSPYHLIRVFQQATGLPPHAYLNQVRVRHACRLLGQGRSIAEVAYATGFSDQSHLTRRFKHIFGLTPGQYRNSVQDRGKESN
jgi:AraC-like DNA-binding protein